MALTTILEITQDPLLGPEGMEALLKFANKIGVRLLIDLATLFILVRGIYYRIHKQEEFFFMFVIFNIIIFFLTFLLNKVDVSLGAAFGLFAVFSMLRYRTESISLKEMTYLFLCIAIGLLTAITKIKNVDDQLENLFLIALNACILLVTWVLETNVLVKKENSRLVNYEKLEYILPERRSELLEDLKKRTGLPIHRLLIQEINFVKSSVSIRIFYYDKPDSLNAE